MQILFRPKVWSIVGAFFLIGIALFLLLAVLSPKTDERLFATVERGTVSEIVSVSGVVEAKNSADLTFPSNGVITDVLVDEGSVVESGDVLATLASTQLLAERQEAVATLRAAEADLAELEAGPRQEAREVTSIAIENARANLEKTIVEERQAVENAQEALYSDNLITRTSNPDELGTPPTVSGTYTCEDAGTYLVTLFESKAASGYSYEISGLETGRYTAFTGSPGAFGSCGLSLQITPGDTYSRTPWRIEIPNTDSNNYLTNLNRLESALVSEATAITEAQNALTLAESEGVLSNAAPRNEELARARSAVTQAKARIAVIDASMADRSIYAPFSGMVTEVSILPGEVAPSTPAISLLATDSFELTIRIPEIDITKIALGQSASVVFDAKADELLSGRVDYISPVATEIDGVAYFEAFILLDSPPAWIRSGLNADIDIVTAEKNDVLRLPKRFIQSTSDGSSFVLIPEQKETLEQSITVGFIGNDGWTEVIGLKENDQVVAP